jgi:hypothetical protein
LSQAECLDSGAAVAGDLVSREMTWLRERAEELQAVLDAVSTAAFVASDPE